MNRPEDWILRYIRTCLYFMYVCSKSPFHFLSDRFAFRSKRISLLVFIYVDLFIQLTTNVILQDETFTCSSIIRDRLCMHRLSRIPNNLTWKLYVLDGKGSTVGFHYSCEFLQCVLLLQHQLISHNDAAFAKVTMQNTWYEVVL